MSNSTTGTICIAVELKVLTCWKCGTLFAVNGVWYEDRVRGCNKPIFCPRGHRNSYRRVCDGLDLIQTADALAEQKTEAAALRQRLTRALHVIDQANLPDPDEPVVNELPPPPPPPSTATPLSWLAASVTGQTAPAYRCARCQQPYNSPQWMRRHLRRQHQIDPDAVFAAADVQ